MHQKRTTATGTEKIDPGPEGEIRFAVVDQDEDGVPVGVDNAAKRQPTHSHWLKRGGTQLKRCCLGPGYVAA